MNDPLLATPGAAKAQPAPAGQRSILAFERGSMQLKYYAPVDNDEQTPHEQDELYIIISGTGEFVRGEERTPFAPHDVLFAAAGVAHRFEKFTDDFATWVVFYGPPGGE
jgi:mannose-6-phosphate isomerase-like protein (cupin superfamily)